MGALVKFHGEDNNKHSVFVWFTSEKQAMDFIEEYQNYGGFTRFAWDYHFRDKVRLSTYLKNSHDLFDALCMVLYNPQLSWVTYLQYGTPTKSRKAHIAGLNTIKEYPDRIKVVKFVNKG